jgi:hypothetical protein
MAYYNKAFYMQKIHKNTKNLVGHRFGKLLVYEMCHGRHGLRKEIAYNCRCDCGGERKKVLFL